MGRIVWVEAQARKGSRDLRPILSAAFEAGFDHLIVPGSHVSVPGLGRISPIVRKEDRFLFDGVEIGRAATIRSSADEKIVRALRGQTKHVVVRTEDWKIIPLENLIAHFQGSDTHLLVEVHDASEAKLVLEAMEVGVDGVLLVTSSSKELRALRGILDSELQRIALVPGRVTWIRSLGLGDRVCIDTCSLLRTGEGMLLGNSSAALFLLHAETLESGYVAARPFRVNAGPVHAYVYLPDGRTKYLSELRAGDEVLVLDASGQGRAAIVGRLKIERRPLLLIEAEAQDRRFTTIVQNAETIRFVTPEGGAISVSEMKVGDPVLLRLEEGGRHTGRRIRETVSER